ncbi:DUF433 domain-containing protein [Alienimonas californiensis]|uniref:DUF433 domain-containing protein n=1 Tax=Alienimonas californiensis TaxID=2527989 RepID=A0A517P6Q6_9PLAN|nr:DUF433 domain-containing protein [Alienimonas californiensis]QDT15070.1 hypothetical protein CA12_11500 [Alienimonas californiensis]
MSAPEVAGSAVIQVDPEILGGMPVFAGTRVPVDTLFVYLRKGYRVEDFCDHFPAVTAEQAGAVLEWTGRQLAAAA